MLKAEEIRKIEIGPRQLDLFDLEDRTTAVQETVMARVACRLDAQGEVEALAFSEFAAEALGVAELTILQHLFWLAHDLKIQFTSAGRAISPNQARSRLIRSIGMPLELTFNQSVKAAVLERVKNLLRHMSEDDEEEAPRNEVELAHRLARKLDAWKSLLEICRTRARRKGFPGRGVIESALARIRTLSAKRDAVSLIHAFYEHADALDRLDADVTMLARFYDHQVDRWQRLLQFARKVDETLDTFEADAHIAAAYKRLKQIMSHPRPYHLVDEACRLQETLEPCHERIVAQRTQQRRAEACRQIKTLIHKMKTHLNRHSADADTRNQSLYVLRQHLKAAEAAPTLERINHRMRSADEDYEHFLDAVSGL